jgi:hypothetical protein
MRSVAVGLVILLSSDAGIARASRSFLIISQDHSFVEGCEHFRPPEAPAQIPRCGSE